MSFRDKFSEFSHLSTDWRRVLTRGVLMLFIGVTLIAFTLFKPDVMLFHARDTSWLPLCGLAVLAVGLLECFDAVISKELKDFFLNLQNGLLDVVVAGLIVLTRYRIVMSSLHEWVRAFLYCLAYSFSCNGQRQRRGFLPFV
ncbi:MAG: hypothetical protein LUO95_03910 [Methylococcaceae bacterium]|nr:hypothetical protein [Methylococcaceae bacterium]